MVPILLSTQHPMTERHDHYIDPVGLSQESNLAHIQGLIKQIAHTSDSRARVVGINAIKAIVEDNPHFRQLPEVTGLVKELRQVRDMLQAQKLIGLVRSQRSTPKQQQIPPAKATTGKCFYAPATEYHPLHTSTGTVFTCLFVWLRCGRRMRSKPSFIHHLPLTGASGIHAADAPFHSQILEHPSPDEFLKSCSTRS